LSDYYRYRFSELTYFDYEIEDLDGRKVGTLRVKPSRLLWKPANAQDFYSISLDSFAEWVTDPETKADKTTR
jgi:hypothetical protein